MAEQRISWFNERDIEKSLNLNPKYQRIKIDTFIKQLIY